MNLFKVLFILLSVLGVTTQFSFSRSLGFNYQAQSSASTLMLGLDVRVFDDVTGAQISNALIDITPTSKGLRAVYVSAAGYSDTAVIGLPDHGKLDVYLVPHYSINEVPVLDGQLTNWDYPSKSKDLHAGVVFRTLSGFDLFNIDQDSFVSPLTDQVDVFGKRDIPSNITLPEQTLKIILLSIKLNKPVYRLPVKSVYPTSLTAVQFKIAGSELMKLATGGGEIGLNILNKGVLQNVGHTKEFTPVRSETLSFPANKKLAPRFKVRLTKPAFAEDVLVASFVDLNGYRESLIPSDIKALESESGKISELILSTPSDNIGHSREVMAVAMSAKGQKTSGVIVEPLLISQTSSDFLPVRDLPATVPALPTSIALSPYNDQSISVLALEGVRENQKGTNELLARVFVLPSVGSLDVQLPQMKHKVQSYSVIDLDFGAGFSEENFDGLKMMKQMKRFSRASVKIEPKTDSFKLRRILPLFL